MPNWWYLEYEDGDGIFWKAETARAAAKGVENVRGYVIKKVFPAVQRDDGTLLVPGGTEPIPKEKWR